MKKLIALLLIMVAISSMAQTFIESENELIGVGADIPGMFSIGVPPESLGAPIQYLLNSSYRSASPSGAYVGFYIDSVLYSTNAMINMIYPDSAVSLIDHQTLPSVLNW